MTLLAAATADAAASGPSDIVSLFWVALAAVAAPLLARAVRGYVPSVVFLLVLGMLIGPSVADLASSSGGLELINELGLGMLFLLAGYELDPALTRGRTGRVAGATWLMSLLIALGLVALVATDDTSVTSIIAVAIAMCSTTLGTLVPILKTERQMDKPLGRAVMAHGAIGEFGPVIAMALLLTGRQAWAAVAVLATFAVAAIVLALVPEHLAKRFPAIGRMLNSLQGGTEQLPVRVVFLLLVVLMAVATEFDLDVVLGAFAAGIILRRLVGAARPDLDEPLEAIGYGVLIPAFFVVSGMGIDPAAVADAPGTWLVFVLIILVARGLPVWLSDRIFRHSASVDTAADRVQLGLYAAAGLPIIVAVTEVGTRTGLLEEDLASTMVAAGATTVLLFPLAAKIIGRRYAGGTAEPVVEPD
ncbi:cation:proton antiporter [Tomitella fengzijianii]|uniref:Cation:proton antiporter n=1 Tax=Tomitella fengzijianii TaxID=2597660 RepID=A0A516X6P6_9ACTN|nr:cation:proton antiporter [Tomitella fengzijianii]QDQ98748.1 cation:proton antiporter [Tomitella fengzijianii]